MSDKAPKTYTIQKYSLSYVREPDHSATKERRRINHRDDVREFCQKYFHDLPIEYLIVIALDNSNHVIGFTAEEGVTNQAYCHPTKVFRFLLSCGATSFVLAHNHPGGSMIASEADWQLTEKLSRAGDLLEIKLQDYVIVGDQVISLRESNRWPTSRRFHE
jgi:DNA repair protein RadC